MATWISRSRTDFSCPICQDVFDDPVVLSCSHSFCRACLESWWTDKPIRECPVCKRPSQNEPPRNLALKNLCETFLQELSLQERASAESESVCSLHSEKLRLYCLDHEQLVCLVCRDAKIHANHQFRPIDEAAHDHKKALGELLRPLQEKLENFAKFKVSWDQTAEYIRVQAGQTESEIREQFRKLHWFLTKEEEARITALREEEEQKSRAMKQRIEALGTEMSALSEAIQDTQKNLKATDVSLLQNYKAAVERVQQSLLLDEPQPFSGALINVADHLGNLAFNIWNKMKEMVSYSPVILDPNTAEGRLRVSADLTSVTFDEAERELPKNPERFESFLEYGAVLASESFDSGTHSWDVAVGKIYNWTVGVIEASVPRKGDIQRGYWVLWCCDGIYIAFAPSVLHQVLYVEKCPRRIRVHLDWNSGTLSFSDPDTDTHIYTFTHDFTERLFPFISSEETKPLKILPMKVTAQLEM